MNKFQKTFAGAGALAILGISGAAAIAQVTYSGSSVYKTTGTGTSAAKIWFSGAPNAVVTMNWSVPATDPAKPAVAKTRSITLNACGIKSVTQSATFPATFTVGSTSYTTASLTAAPNEPYCKKGTPYVPATGWMSSLPQLLAHLIGQS